MTEGGSSDYIKENWESILTALPELTEKIFFNSSVNMGRLDEGSVDLVVTSPPYPMVEMWDTFGDYDDQHEMILDVIRECWRVLREGGIMCINIGDATRSVDGSFKLFPNHAEIMVGARGVGFDTLIPIQWFKPTNKPNSFLGSGFHPPNCYVTQDTEYILVFRKGEKRSIGEDKRLWNASQFMKSERDTWFSQQWDVRGANQEGRAQFPAKIPYRLIRMFSVLGDTVLDPFAGTGTTLEVGRSLGRSVIGYEINESLDDEIWESIRAVEDISGKDVLRNHVRSENNGGDNPEVFLRNEPSLIDVLP